MSIAFAILKHRVYNVSLARWSVNSDLFIDSDNVTCELRHQTGVFDKWLCQCKLQIPSGHDCKLINFLPLINGVNSSIQLQRASIQLHHVSNFATIFTFAHAHARVLPHTIKYVILSEVLSKLLPTTSQPPYLHYETAHVGNHIRNTFTSNAWSTRILMADWFPGVGLLISFATHPPGLVFRLLVATSTFLVIEEILLLKRHLVSSYSAAHFESDASDVLVLVRPGNLISRYRPHLGGIHLSAVWGVARWEASNLSRVVRNT